MVMGNIKHLETQAREVFTGLGYSEKTMKVRILTAKRIIELHNEHGIEDWNDDIVAGYIKAKEASYQIGKIGKGSLDQYKNIIRHLAQINEFGTITCKKHSYLPELPGGFKQIIADILTYDDWNHKTQKHVANHASTFFRWLAAKGHCDMKRVGGQVTRQYLIDCSKRMAAISLDNTRRALKKLFLFISEDGLLPNAMNKLFLFRIPIDKKVKAFMPQDEIAAVLNVIDRSTKTGKRDYAIILLATVTGLRRVDIVELAFDSVAWRNGELRIVQEKTGKALALPLTTDVGTAILNVIKISTASKSA